MFEASCDLTVRFAIFYRLSRTRRCFHDRNDACTESFSFQALAGSSGRGEEGQERRIYLFWAGDMARRLTIVSNAAFVAENCGLSFVEGCTARPCWSGPRPAGAFDLLRMSFAIGSGITLR